MTQEEKDLLLKDLCSRLSYDVKLSYRCNHTHVLRAIHKSGLIVINDTATNITTTTDVENIKPYLFPLSSMTEEQKKEYDKIIYRSIELHHREYSDIVEIDLFDNLQEFYHKNHLDYRGLIPLGLANDATGLNVY